jgi:hypothetical protein
MKNFVFLFIVLLLLSCSSENGTKPELTNPIVESVSSESPTQRDRTWDLVVEDDDGWEIFLDVVRDNYYETEWRGELVFGSSSQFSGPACAYYDKNADLFSMSSKYVFYSSEKTIIYSYKFVDEVMDGFYFFHKDSGYLGNPIDAWITSGYIGPHLPTANSNSPSGELSPKAQRTED